MPLKKIKVSNPLLLNITSSQLRISPQIRIKSRTVFSYATVLMCSNMFLNRKVRYAFCLLVCACGWG